MTLLPILLTGYLTLWTRPGSGDLPIPTSPSQTVSGTLDSTVKPGTVSRFKAHFNNADLEGDFQVFFMNPKVGNPYIITQIDLMEPTTHKPLGECSSYHSVEDAVPFPVGSCSVFIDKNGNPTQTGVSFSRIAF